MTTTTKLTIIAALLLFSTIVHAAGTAINETGEMPDASAILDARSETKGFLPPRMTAAQRGAIATTATAKGLLVYQTDGATGLYTFDGAAWNQVGAGSVTAVTAAAPLASSGGSTPQISLSGAIPVASGGTGATTQAGAATALLPTQTSNSGKYLTTDGTNASWGTVASDGGGGSSTVTATASGALTAGQLVEFTSTGEVKSIVTTNSGTSNAISSFVSGQAVTGAGTGSLTTHIVSAFVGTDKVVVAYNQADGIWVVAGTLTGTTVTWGSPIKVSGSYTSVTGICPLEADKFALSYGSSASPPYIRVGQITGASITLGGENWYNIAGTYGGNFQCTGTGNNHIVVSAQNSATQVWTYNPSTLALTFGSEGTGKLGGYVITTSPSILQYDVDKFLWVSAHGGSLYFSVPVTLSAVNQISAGWLAYSSVSANPMRAIKTSISSNPARILYVWSSGGVTYTQIATVTTGNVISMIGTPVTLPTAFIDTSLNLANTADNMAVLTGTTSGDNMVAVAIDTSGTNAVVGSYSTLLASGKAANLYEFRGNSHGNGNGRFISAYYDVLDSNKPKVVVGQMGNSTTVNRANATGIVTAGAADGATATITLIGSTASVYSGLTPGALYYIQADGSIGTTVTAYPAGVAINSTTLQMYSTGAISNSSITVSQNAGNQIKSNSGNTAVYTEFSTGDESVRVYAAGKSSFYADGHTDSSLNVDRGMIYTAININNLASGGVIGTAALTVDMGSFFSINQTTDGQTVTLPNPTNIKAGRIVYLNNSGSTSFTAYSTVVPAGTTVTLTWNGSAWQAPTVAPASSAANITGGTAGAVAYQSGASTTGFTAAGTLGQVLTSNGTSPPTWSSNISGSAANVTGTVSTANGGTGSTDGSITGSGTLTFTAGGTNQNVTLTPTGTGYTLLGGNVGIGTTTPGNKLQIGSTTYSGNSLAMGNGTQNFAIDISASTIPTFFSDNNFSFMGSGGSGNVGIGTTTPYTTLTVGSNDATAKITAGGANTHLTLASAGSDGSIYLNAGGVESGNYSTSTRLSVGANGNVGIGTKTPGQKLDVAGNIKISNQSGRVPTPDKIDLGSCFSDGTTRDQLKIYLYDGGGNEKYGFGIGSVSDIQYHSQITHDFYVNNAKYFSVTASGGANTSDRRLKRDILPLSKYGLQQVMQLNPVTYIFNADSTDTNQVGFIAQEVQQIIPEVVTGKEGDLSKGESLGIVYGNLVPVLTKAIQELKAENDELKKELAVIKKALGL
ncbi:MAG: tail fiber domain-containing protein [Deltaproteobacteria bacterium]|nr:tail fiber domain-containing protein [Deltaproteobacteria bacterium]